jgi:hypothetical protein
LKSANIVEGVNRMNEIEKLRQIDEFHRGRIKKIRRNEMPLPFHEDGKIVLHMIPHDALQLETYYDLSAFNDDLMVLKPLKDAGHDLMYIFDGLLSFSKKEEGCLGYALLRGNGIIEAVDSWYLYFAKNEDELIPLLSVEEAIKNRTAEYLALQEKLGAKLPIIMYLNFLNVKGYKIGTPSGFYIGNTHAFESEDLNFQRLIIGNYDASAEKLLKTWFDRLWNAGGYARSPHYDSSGNWIKR